MAYDPPIANSLTDQGLSSAEAEEWTIEIRKAIQSVDWLRLQASISLDGEKIVVVVSQDGRGPLRVEVPKGRHPTQVAETVARVIQRNRDAW